MVSPSLLKLAAFAAATFSDNCKHRRRLRKCVGTFQAACIIKSYATLSFFNTLHLFLFLAANLLTEVLLVLSTEPPLQGRGQPPVKAGGHSPLADGDGAEADPFI